MQGMFDVGLSVWVKTRLTTASAVFYFQGRSFDSVGVVYTCFGFGFWHLGFWFLVFGFGLWAFGRLGVWAFGCLGFGRLDIGRWALAFGFWCLGFGVWASVFGLQRLGQCLGFWHLGFWRLGFWRLGRRHRSRMVSLCFFDTLSGESHFANDFQANILTLRFFLLL